MSSVLNAIRESAWRAFASDGMPSSRDEDWKYTDLSRITAVQGDLWWESAGKAVVDADSVTIPGLDAYRLVICNGVVDLGASVIPDAITITPLASLLQDDPDAVVELMLDDRDAPFASGITALNSARASDGCCICVPDSLKLDRPIHILHLSSGGASHTRTGITVGSYAEVEIIEHFAGSDVAEGVTNSVTAIRLAAGAKCEHYRLQLEGAKQWHLGRVEVNQKRDSNYTMHAVELGSQLSRVDVVNDLNEPGAESELNGLFVLSGRQHVDHHTRIAHEVPHCRSRENYRTVLDGRSHGVFNGKVVVAEGAIKTDSAQSNANLLLSNRAEIDTKPELEIYNDDVKCAHGATVGQLDKNQLFYLKSRGLSEEEAKQLLTFAFADAILARMGSDSVRRYIERAAFAKLPNISGLEGLLV
ncbi:Iron-regulated ABC transporter permease protein SufD [Mariprofundus ferrinatatus]|uniref:Iron-regulated ABC transporter permease protein SufD n=1 Tax=Mariprofundus ferrinatatus TaxID=1921087 RepID=A0A2K8L0W7_9PROT|nr:Fe-S cluster assembly protein SufD [Mariprofundus ferrinatatus]ATX80938.1 Iron-regulated ABC transporter permease protein SufD [Mariprofundus ferrinatatus]